ncbi:MAG: cation:proton antiporter [Desulfobacterales bacterium]|jgi:predicted Kef-type K+ transport protein
MDSIAIIIAFALGFAARQVGLPPLVGYLVAGFVIKASGLEGGALIIELAEVGILLLLFSIGLKLKLRSLTRPEVWAGASIHMLVTVTVFGAGIFMLAAAGLSKFAALDFKLCLLIAFALSFSSTVFAVKILEEKGEMAALHGRVAIGILIVQDIIAVIFITASTGKLPSPWALLVPVILYAVRPLLLKIMDRCGHGELVILFGLLLALVAGAEGFELVGLKPDLGALILGMLVASHPKASEMANALFSFKELFLVGFFLSIGLKGLPDMEALGIATLFVMLTPFKVGLFFLLLTRFKLRARTALLGSFSLANYSEFGLIVAYIGETSGWISSEWLVIIAIALSTTFVLASPLNAAAHDIYSRFAKRLRPYETKTRHPDDQLIDPGDAEIAIFGMGRVGTGAYDFLREHYGDVIIGCDSDPSTVRHHQVAGRNVVLDDPTDLDFWEKSAQPSENDQENKIRLAVLAMPKFTANMQAAKLMTQAGFKGLIAASARFDDEVKALKEAGVQAYNFFDEAGAGLAEAAYEKLKSTLKDKP